jgi:hypothetical protein
MLDKGLTYLLRAALPECVLDAGLGLSTTFMNTRIPIGSVPAITEIDRLSGELELRRRVGQANFLVDREVSCKPIQPSENFT